MRLIHGEGPGVSQERLPGCRLFSPIAQPLYHIQKF
jgi:hypothetical protein